MSHNLIHPFIHSFVHALAISIFVLSMMLFIDFLNVASMGKWQTSLKRYLLGQHIIGSLLGATPGCFGTFAVVSLYSHKIFKVGAVVAATIATSGDEAFVMFAMFPEKAVLLTGILFLIGIITGVVTDLVMGNRFSDCPCEDNFEIHQTTVEKKFKISRIIPNLKSGDIRLLIILASLAAISSYFLWKSIAETPSIQSTIFTVVPALAFVIISMAEEHFIREHLWEHLILKHAPKIFLWTFGAFVVISILLHNRLDSTITGNPALIMLVAALIGLIPESGPHLIFVTMFANGMIPFSILLASSISQDGHGAIPLLAHSRKDFIMVKLINLFTALLFGYTLWFIGY
ncbi:MAG: arsenic efflux protein [Deltaproteobacteria bacterium]|nr:arsenic efflux protein [Deltaproteobacteria bacterium]